MYCEITKCPICGDTAEFQNGYFVECVRGHVGAVCIEDFCGTACRGIPCSFWADYLPWLQVVRFGGDWADVPDMPSEEEPTSEVVNKWAESHGGFWWEDSNGNTI